MNLYTPAGGLFGTHVTWSDIEEDMRRELNTTASFGPNKTVKDIGENNGFMSKILLIEPDWQHKEKEVPDKFVVKILTQLAMQKLSAEVAEQKKMKNVFSDPEFMASLEKRQKKCHNVEVAVYNHLLKLPEGKINIPKIYYMKKFSESNPLKGYIIMGYMENITPVHIYETFTPAQVKQVLRNKAVIEAMSLNLTSEERDQLTTSPFKELFAEFYSKESMDTVMTIFRKFEGGKFKEKAIRLERILQDLSDLSRADSLSEECGMDRVLCHGDLWSMNTLWRKDGKEFSLAALIDYQEKWMKQMYNTVDAIERVMRKSFEGYVLVQLSALVCKFQTAHFGCAATDLVRLLATCLSGKDRRAEWEGLLKVFYGYLLEELGGRKVPYTLEQLKESYRRFFPLGGYMTIPMIGALFETLYKNPDEQLRRKCMEIVSEKIDCILDDIFYYHDRNMSIQKGKRVI